MVVTETASRAGFPGARERGAGRGHWIRNSTRGSLLYPSKLEVLLFEGPEVAIGYASLSDGFPCVGEDGFEVFGCRFETGQEAIGGFDFWLHASRIGKWWNCEALSGLVQVAGKRRLAEDVWRRSVDKS